MATATAHNTETQTTVFRVESASFVSCRPEIARTLPHIPGTEFTLDYTVGSKLYNLIMNGYVEMRANQKRKPQAAHEWSTIKVPEDGKLEDQFKEALNIFYRFMQGEGRDNHVQVLRITQIE